MYSIAGYGKMMADEGRMVAYSGALHRAVRPGSVVLDLGAGTGILSLLACQYGARKVYAVEPSNAIFLAEQAARANGFDHRIHCIQALSTEITLPEKVDVIVSDLRGVLPLFEQHLTSIADARRRLLASGGNLIPKHDILSGAVVEAPQQYDDFGKPWERFGFKMDAASEIILNNWNKARVIPDQLLSKPQIWTNIDYLSVDSADVHSKMEFQIVRPGTAHGFIVWFDTVLEEGIGFSNGPGQPELIYGAAFFPWSSPVELSEQHTVSIDLRADLVGSDYIWYWETQLFRGDDVRPQQHFRQSTFFGSPVSPRQLCKRSASYQPKLTQEGQIDAEILNLMDGTHSNQEIAKSMTERFPAKFSSAKDVLTRISSLAEKYSQ
jgi:protein arginine N-methyltransferase 1